LLTAQAENTPNKPYMIWYDSMGLRGELSYAEFLIKVRQLSARLASYGIQVGDKVGTLSGNYPETVLTYFACWYCGATVVPLSTGEDNARLGYIIADAGIKLIFTRPELAERVHTILATVVRGEKVRVVTGTEENLPIDRVSEPAYHNDPDTTCFIVYTSGTTGHPKGVMLDHYNLLVDGRNLADWHQIGRDSRMMCVLPIHHVNGTIVTIITPLIAGSSFVLNEKFSVHTFFPRLASECVSVVSVVPTLLAFLLEAKAKTDGLDLSHLRHIICGAGPLTVDLALRFENQYHIPIAHGYGLSETTCYSCCLPVSLLTLERQGWLAESGYPSIGTAFPCNEMAIHNGEGEPLPAGQRGEIVIRGHNVMQGYFGNEEANDTAFAGGWFHSGDEGFWLPGPEGEPYYFITGRLKELIIRGGVNISPLEIDEVLMSLPGVRAGIAVGFDHYLYGEEVGACVIRMDAHVTPEQVISVCRDRLPHHKVPKVVIFVEELPVTSTGKYQRNRLRLLFNDWKNARFK